MMSLLLNGAAIARRGTHVAHETRLARSPKSGIAGHVSLVHAIMARRLEPSGLVDNPGYGRFGSKTEH
jgi:hypothetical protein